MKIAFKILIFAMVVGVILFTLSQRTYLQGIYHNNLSLKKVSEKMNYEALSEAIDALKYLPLAPELHLNLGDLYLINKDFEKAQKEFGTSARLALQNEEMKFDGLFNAGVAATQLKKTDEALTFYQSALDLKSESVETKTNIELLVQSQKGGGEGEGESDPKKDPKDDKGKQSDRNDPNQKFKNDPPKNQPQPYKGKEISKENVNKILDELKQQEQNVRAKFENHNVHNSKNEKDW